MMDESILVLGASGATGRLLVRQLLDRGLRVRAVMRPGAGVPDDLAGHERLDLRRANLLELDDAAMAELIQGCGGMASCLGHNVSFKGLFGQPRRLVTDAMRKLSRAVEARRPETPVRLVLMNTVANCNPDLDEALSVGHRLVIGLLRALLPPHADNEQAAEHLRTRIGQDNSLLEWVTVRPDALFDAERPSEYRLHPSPIRSAIFDPGRTSRVNVAHFMAELLTDEALWGQWRGRMPVIYDEA